MGLVNRLAAPGQALVEAQALARQLEAFPQLCLRGDRLSAHEQFGLSLGEAIENEWVHGSAAFASEASEGAQRFAGGAGRHGAPA